MATFLVMVIFIIPIMLGIFLLRRSRKVALALISIPFIFMIIVSGWYVYEANHRFIGNSDLAGEQLDNIELRKPMNESFKDDHGEYSSEENVRYREYLEFELFSAGVSFDTNKITFIETEDDQLSTMNDIYVGDSVDKVIEKYGEKYYKSNEMGQGQTINYVDRDAKIHLQFWLEDDKVHTIALYAM